MVSEELKRLADAVANIQADTLDRLPIISQCLRGLADGVESLERVVVPSSARVIPAGLHDHLVPAAGNVIPFRRAAK